MIILITKLDETEPADLEKINGNFQALVEAINALAREEVVQFGVVTGEGGIYMMRTGGQFIGQVAAPSYLKGTAGETQYPLISTSDDDAATPAQRGAVKQAAALANMSTAISNPPTQAEVTELRDKLNTLLANLRTAEVQAT